MITRLAPSPTGALHLGNARTFLLTWLLARAAGGSIVLRVEDLDGPRVKPDADRAAIDDLRWLGLDWDGEPTRQSERLPLYAAAIERLLAAGNAYPCVCTRAEVGRAASAPHADDGAAVYPGTCRDRFASVEAARLASGRAPAIRFRVDDDESIRWHDRAAGGRAVAMRGLGDFAIAKADGTPAYQLAVVVDDAAAGVTDVVRGDDLLDSTPRQMTLYRALNLGPPPTYHHLPLVVGPDGRRLAKRHGDTRVSTYRAAGVPAGRLIALLARWSGIDVAGDDIDARSLLGRFDPIRLPRDAVVATAADDRWLRAGSTSCDLTHP